MSFARFLASASLLILSACSAIPGVGTADLAMKAGMGCVEGALEAAMGMTGSLSNDFQAGLDAGNELWGEATDALSDSIPILGGDDGAGD